MKHFYERNITDIKQEYTIFLTNILTPLLYEGIKKLYNQSLEFEKKFEIAQTKDPNIKNPGVLKLFQKFLKNLPNLNNHLIETETNRLRDNSKCADIFDDLIKAVIKSNIILLTFNATDKTCNIVKERYHENIDVKEFIHKCYIECAKIFYDYPEIFWHKYSTIDIKRNQREAHDLVKKCIVEAIRKMLPMKLILEEYLKNDYVENHKQNLGDINQAEYTNIKNLLKRDLYNQNGGNSILEDSEFFENSENDNKTDEVGNIVNNKIKNESSDENINKFDDHLSQSSVKEIKKPQIKSVNVDINTSRASAANSVFKNALNSMNKNITNENITSPKQVVESPKKVVESPKKVVESPKQVTSPKQVVESPKQVVESPKQVVESPKQVVESPKQVVESPKQVVESPKQVVESPKQVIESPKKKMSININRENDISSMELKINQKDIKNIKEKINNSHSDVINNLL